MAWTPTYNKTSVDKLLLDCVKGSGDQQAAGNKTFTRLTRLEGGFYTRRHIVSGTATAGSFVVGSLLRFASGPPGYAVTLPSPSAHPSGRIAIHLQHSPVTIATQSGVFAGMGGGASTQTLTIATHSAYPELISDGDNWLLIAQGLQGPDGATGPQGATGPAGPAGATGATGSKEP